jgi:hypothetical protein
MQISIVIAGVAVAVSWVASWFISREVNSTKAWGEGYNFGFREGQAALIRDGLDDSTVEIDGKTYAFFEKKG